MKKLLILTLLLFPFLVRSQAVPGCGSFTISGPITATSNSTISGKSIDLSNAATVGITIPNGAHDIHVTKCIVKNSTALNGLIKVGSGCYNITIDTCYFENGWRGINVVGATNNIHIWYNYFHNIIDPNVLTSHTTDGGGSSVQLNNCNGVSIQVLDNKSYHDASTSGVGDQFSVFQCNGTPASPIRVCRNQAVNGSTNIPANGYVGAVGGDVGGSYQRIDSNTFVNVGSVLCQVQGGHDIEMSYNTGYLAQTSYTSVGIAYGNYSGAASYNITISHNNVRCIQASGSVFNYWYDPSLTAPTGWSTNTTSTSLNAGILPNPLWPACSSTVAAPVISYFPLSYVFTTGTAIAAIIPTSTGGPIVNYTVSPALPASLGLNSITGIISGTSTVVTSATVYTVVAHNSGGTSSVPITITTRAPVIVPPSITYSPNTLVAMVGTAITTLSPANTGGAVSSYAISPALPLGLSFNTSSGQISGTPATTSTITTYTITATNGGGTGTAPVTITVNPVRPAIAYAGSPYTFTQGSLIIPLVPINTGGPIVSYSISPAIPAGLSFSTSTGIISGTPAGTQTATPYVVTAANAGGSSTANISIAINAPAVLVPVISYAPSSATVLINTPVVMVPVNTGGAAVSWAISPALPTGISFNTANGLISGTPTVTSALQTYSITATNTGGTSAPATVAITVNQIPSPSITYPYSLITYVQSQVITTILPTNTGGAISSYAVTAGTLPAGLSLNTVTGAISGIPTATQAPTSFTVTATNSGGTSNYAIQAAVNPAPAYHFYILDGKFFGPVNF